jgi:hypothetical protein
VIALLAGDPAVAVALLTLRPTCGTRVRSLFSTSFMLRRSCAARHGYTSTEPGQDQPLLYYYRELIDVPF